MLRSHYVQPHPYALHPRRPPSPRRLRSQVAVCGRLLRLRLRRLLSLLPLQHKGTVDAALCQDRACVVTPPPTHRRHSEVAAHQDPPPAAPPVPAAPPPRAAPAAPAAPPHAPARMREPASQLARQPGSQLDLARQAGNQTEGHSFGFSLGGDGARGGGGGGRRGRLCVCEQVAGGY
eukprot:COSAG01_NODE_9597_length_2395_cov_27.035714_1_plen_177_part_00